MAMLCLLCGLLVINILITITMDFNTIKALHIIFMVSWFAGLFYIPRLFIYHTEALKQDEPARSILSAQFKIMQRKLWYIITWPAGILTLVFGIWMLVINPDYLQMPWMHLKLAFVLVLIIYHLVCHRMYQQLQKDIAKNSSTKLRLWNELATLLLIAIVFIVVFRNTLSWIWGVVGIFLIAGILTAAVAIYKKRRAAKGEKVD